MLNGNRGTCLADRAETADSLWKRMKGLIGRSPDEFHPGSGLWIRPSEGIHTFGMRFPIDVVYLDAKGKVIRLYHSLRPNRLGAVMLKSHSVLELPAGTLARTHTEPGDLIEFRELTASGSADTDGMAN